MLPSINQFNHIGIQNGDITSGNKNKGSKHYQDEQNTGLSAKRIRHWSPETSDSHQEASTEDGSSAVDDSAADDSAADILADEHFHSSYKKMNKQHKCRLKSGEFLEDKFYSLYKDQDMGVRSRSLAGSHIFDWSTDQHAELINSTDRKAFFRDTVDQIANLPQHIKDIFDHLNVVDESALRQRLADLLSGHSFAGVMDVDTIFWLVSSILHWRSLCHQHRFQSDNTEQTWAGHIWIPFFDKIMQAVPKMALQRGETASTSSSRRKNENRTHATKNRRRMGGRVDGVLRRERNWEYLVIEAAKHLKDGS
ncbi:hypothetical protein BDR22DRAFT_893834 [Usnea florida]